MIMIIKKNRDIMYCVILLSFSVFLCQPTLYASHEISWEHELLQGAQTGNLARVQDALNNEVDVNNVYTSQGDTALILAARNNRENIVRTLLRAGAGVDVPNEDNNDTALSEAAYAGHENIVRILLEAGANPDLPTGWYDETPLIQAATQGHASVVRLLMEEWLAIPPTATERANLPANARQIVQSSMNVYIQNLVQRAGAKAVLLHQEGLPNDLILLTLEKMYGPYIREHTVRTAIINALRD